MRKELAERAETGKKAEELALKYLTDRGQRLLARNWRYGHKEIDLIMESTDEHYGMILHIVEVRSLTEPVRKMPFETVGNKKQRAVMAAARSYIYQNNLNCDTQFDVVSVTFGTYGERLEYYPKAFTPTWR